MLISSPLAAKGADVSNMKSARLLHSPLQPDTQFGHVPKLFTRQSTSRRSSVATLRSSEIVTSREPSGNAGLESEGENFSSSSNQCRSYALLDTNITWNNAPRMLECFSSLDWFSQRWMLDLQSLAANLAPNSEDCEVEADSLSRM